MIKQNDDFVKSSVQFENEKEAEIKEVNVQLEDCKHKLKLIENKFDIDYDHAARLKDDSSKLRNKLLDTRKVVENIGGRKKVISPE